MSDIGNKKVFAENLKRYMKIHNIDRQQLCQNLGFKYTTVSEWLVGNKYPRIDKIEMLANYFNIQKSDLIEEKDKEKQPTKNSTEIQRLFDIVKDCSKEEIEQAIRIIEALRKD